MNFGRELAVLRQRLTAAGSEEEAEKLQARHGDACQYLGAPDDEALTAATELVETYPEMGRAQMTAFVRTLWKAKVHELRVVGVEVLAARAHLLEPPDMPFVIELVEQANTDALTDRVADAVLGPLVGKNKKLWRDLQKLAKKADARLQRAAVRGARAPLANDGSVFDRFEKLATPLVEQDGADAEVLAALDAALAAASEHAGEDARRFAAAHGREIAEQG